MKRAIVNIVLIFSALVSGNAFPDASVSHLTNDLQGIRSEIKSAEVQSSRFEGGLLKALIEARLETLRTTAALIEQRIQAEESGAEITIQIPGTQPDQRLAERLKQEIDKQQRELSKARNEADKHSGGLIGVMALATVATHEQTIAMLQQRYIAAKYGLPYSLPDVPDDLSISGPAAPEAKLNSAGNSKTVRDSAKQILQVTLLDKRYNEQDYQDFMSFDVQVKAINLSRPARAIKGVLNFQDLFEEPKLQLKWTIDEPLKPNETLVEKGIGFKYNQFLDSHSWVRSTDVEDMTASYTVKSIIYQDGTREDF